MKAPKKSSKNYGSMPTLSLCRSIGDINLPDKVSPKVLYTHMESTRKHGCQPKDVGFDFFTGRGKSKKQHRAKLENVLKETKIIASRNVLKVHITKENFNIFISKFPKYKPMSTKERRGKVTFEIPLPDVGLIWGKDRKYKYRN